MPHQTRKLHISRNLLTALELGSCWGNVVFVHIVDKFAVLPLIECVWLQVIPQLIARIDTPRPLVSRLIHQLLTDVGKHHPQAGIFDHILLLASLENRENILCIVAAPWRHAVSRFLEEN